MNRLTIKILRFVLLSYLGFSCSITIPRAINENPLGTSVGKSTKTTYLGIFSVGEDASIEQAARNGSLKTISTVDYQITNFLGLVSNQTVIVTGSQTMPEPIVQHIDEEKIAQATVSEPEKKEIIVNPSPAVNTTKTNAVPETIKESVVKNDSEKPKINSAIENKEFTSAPKLAEEVKPSNKVENRETKRVEVAEELISSENKDTNKRIKGFSIKAKSLSDFSKKIREESSEYMQYGDLTPINVKLNLTTLTFSCDFVQKTSGLIKMGLFYGPKSIGCESCENVLANNPGSEVLAKSANNTFVSQLIGIYSK